MQERDIRLLFKTGHWKKALIIPHHADEGWQVLLYSSANDEEPIVLSSKRGGPRVFKTSDTALVWCQQIGFESVKVHLVTADNVIPDDINNLAMECSILLVEDNEDDIELTRYALRKHKISNQIVVKRDGSEAIDYLFNEIKKTDDLPCLILLDLHLPKVSGLEVLEKIRNNNFTKSIPVVILSTSDLNSDIEESYKLGSNSYICKPNDIDQFSDTIKRLGTYWTELNLRPS